MFCTAPTAICPSPSARPSALQEPGTGCFSLGGHWWPGCGSARRAEGAPWIVGLQPHVAGIHDTFWPHSDIDERNLHELLQCQPHHPAAPP